jgi:hypothetical protein
MAAGVQFRRFAGSGMPCLLWLPRIAPTQLAQLATIVEAGPGQAWYFRVDRLCGMAGRVQSGC